MAAYNAAGHLEGYEIFIKYLPSETTEEPLREFFSPAGDIVGAPRLMVHPQTGKCKGIGWVTFASAAGQAEALRWDGCAYGGRHLNITAAKQMHTGIRPSVQAPGTHTPAMLRECVAKMVGSDANGVFIDGTFGRGGHSRGILAALGPNGQLHAFDMDPDAITAGKELAKADKRFIIHHASFSSMEKVLRPILEKAPPAQRHLHGVFFDLGISSPQFDEAHRGFRPEADGPLDLRFDNTSGVPAWEFLQTAAREEITRVLHEYGETTDPTAARRIADAICLARDAKALPRRTREFAALVAEAKGHEYQPMHAAKLTFQALRIHLNDEFGEMRHGMHAAASLLAPGGRIGLITWKHSECAVVVDVFRSLETVRNESPLAGWYRAQRKLGDGALPPLPGGGWALTIDETTRPSESELQSNSRSRSALLHILRKVEAPRMVELEAMAYKKLGWGGAGKGCTDKDGNGTAAETAERRVNGEAHGVDGGELSKEQRKARKAEMKAAAKARKLEGGVDADSPVDELARKTQAARRNLAEKKALKKRLREEGAESAGGKRARAS